MIASMAECKLGFPCYLPVVIFIDRNDMDIEDLYRMDKMYARSKKKYIYIRGFI